jgi:UDP-GlcNAc:undecaprenyl-phosphate GlcNAc-1-phosphate transferase
VTAGILPWQAANAPLTLVWIVAITNAFNLLDNMDGLAVGVAGIAALGFFALAALNGQFLVPRPRPGRLRLRLPGPQPLAHLDLCARRRQRLPRLAVTAVMLNFGAGGEAAVLGPVLVLGVALFDTALVVTTRTLYRQKPWCGARDHISHRLVTLGRPVRGAVALVYAGGAALAALALLVDRVEPASESGAVVLGAIAVIVVGLGMALGLVPVYETSRRRRVPLTSAMLGPDGLATGSNGGGHATAAEPDSCARGAS